MELQLLTAKVGNSHFSNSLKLLQQSQIVHRLSSIVNYERIAQAIYSLSYPFVTTILTVKLSCALLYRVPFRVWDLNRL